MSDYHRAFEDGRHYHGWSFELPKSIFPTEQERKEAAERVKVRRTARLILMDAGIDPKEVMR